MISFLFICTFSFSISIASSWTASTIVRSADPSVPTWIATDIEGNFPRLQHLLEQAIINDKLNGRIVFNGDLVGLQDRKMDLVIMKAFIHLQEKYGSDKIILIIGNRELQLFDRLSDYKINEPERYEISKSFLNASQLFYRVDQTLIFHGAFTLDNYRYHPETHQEYATPRLALYGLESWYQQVKKLALENHAESIAKLVAYGRQQPNTPKLNSYSIVYGRYSGEGAEQQMPSHNILDFYKSIGISLFINGHTPVGRIPVFMSEEGFGILVGDTSRSSMQLPEIKLLHNVLTVQTPYLKSRIGFKWKIGSLTRYGQKNERGILVGRSLYDDYYYKAEKLEAEKPKYIQFTMKTPRIMCLHLFN